MALKVNHTRSWCAAMWYTNQSLTYCIVIPIGGHIDDPGIGSRREMASFSPSPGAG